MQHSKARWDISPLNAAAVVENEQDLTHAIQSTFPIGLVDGSCSTGLHEAATRSASVHVEELKHDCTEDSRTHSDQTPLVIAVKEKNGGEAENSVPLLLQNSANAHVSCTECTEIILEFNIYTNLKKYLKFLLAAAAKKGHVECLKMFLACNDDPNLSMKLRIVPLIAAARHGHPECVNVLLGYDANQNLQMDKAFNYALLAAVKHGHAESLKVLLDCKFDPNLNNKLLEILLMTAVLNGRAVCVKLLLDYHVDPNFFMDQFLEEPFFCAIESDHAECENILHEYTSKLLQKVNHSSKNPLLAAIMKGYTEYAEILNGYHSDSILKMELLQETPLLAAARNGHTECVKLLLDSNANPRLRVDKFHETPLIAAVDNGHIECVKFLLYRRCDPNSIMLQFPMYPLIAAIKNGDTECVKILLDYNAKADVRVGVSYIHGKVQPLHLAIYHDRPDCVKLLLDNMSRQWPTHTSTDSTCPLYFAVKHERHECIKILLSCDYPVNSLHIWENGICRNIQGFQIQKFSGETALSLAASFGDLVSMKLLLESGANVNPVCYSIDGKLNHSIPPIFRALSSIKGKPQFLIKHGCDISYHRENVPSNECLLFSFSDYDSTKNLLLWGSDPHLLFQKGSADGQQYFVNCLTDAILWIRQESILRILELLLLFTVVTEPVQISFRAVVEYCREVQWQSMMYQEEYDAQRWNKILIEVDKPSSLKNLCRIKIRQLMIFKHGYASFRKAIRHLCFPKILKKYLFYRELK